MEIIDTTRREGGCRCSAIRFEAGALMDNAHVCHCRMCQKATGNFLAPLVAVRNQALRWTRDTPAIFASSEGIERGFCRDCGTPLFLRRSDGAHTSLTIPSFDDPGAIPLLYEFGIDSRLPQLDQLGHLDRHTSQELIGEAGLAHIRETSRQSRPE